MTEKEQKYLSDIELSINYILEFVNKMSFSEYEKDFKTKSAVERQLGIIGEVVNKLTKESGKIKLEHSKQIISLRNRIIHAYDGLDDSMIWVIIKKHLMLLQKELKTIN